MIVALVLVAVLVPVAYGVGYFHGYTTTRIHRYAVRRLGLRRRPCWRDHETPTAVHHDPATTTVNVIRPTDPRPFDFPLAA